MLFTIRKGSHSPLLSQRIIRRHKHSVALTGTFVLPKEAWYDTKVHGTHINKLVGSSNDLFNTESVRLGWRPAAMQNVFEIYVYIHLGGGWVRSERLRDDLVETVMAEVTNNYSVLPAYGMWKTEEDGIAVNHARCVVNGSVVDRPYDVRMGTGWIMNPYFGGRPTAPNDINIYLGIDGITTSKPSMMRYFMEKIMCPL